MSTSRRELLSAASAAVGVGMINKLGVTPGDDPGRTRRKKTDKHAIDLRAKPLDRIRLAFIGVGARGSGHVYQCTMMEGVEIVAICDNHKPTLDGVVKRLTERYKRPVPALYGKDANDYKRMLDRDDIDAVIISTPWDTHVPMALDAMNKGKHAFIEVPAAITVDECWALVDTAEKTQLHCMMMENVNYGREELVVLNMCRMGKFGELLHGEAAYIHDLRWQMKEIEHGTGSWRTLEYTKRNGNLYPTHGLGPICHYMDINRGDRMDYMSSVGSNARAREIYAKKEFPAGHDRQKLKFVCGDINTSIIRTVRGKTIMLQWDEQLPRPYTRHNLVQGTRGVWAGFPDRVVIEGESKSTEEWVEGNDLNAWMDKYEHPLWKQIGEEAKKAGGHGGMDFVMLWRIMYNLRNGRPMDQDVYDAATWSVVGPLSEFSVANRGRSVDVPDFTRGRWKDRKSVSLLD